MKTKLDKNPNTVLTIGTFDGVHIGHQKILKRLLKVARSKNLEATLLTFFPHPRMVLQKENTIKLINTMSEKSKILKKLGLNNLIIREFNDQFAMLSAEEFVENILVNELNTKHVIIGYDHHFGRNRAANISDLKAFGGIYEFDVEEISAQDINDVAVSSTLIRKALLEGNIKTANAYLGYDFMLTGNVVKGKRIGRTLGFPTANINIEEDYKLIPKNGVYIIKTIFKNQLIWGMLNIGKNPTVGGETKTIEVHLFDFNDSIYGETICIELVKRLRNEQKFESVNALKQQLNKDKTKSLNYLST